VTAVLEIVVPVFGLVLLGYALGRPPLFGAGSARTLGTFVFYLALPALLFRSMVQQGPPSPADVDILATYYAGVATVGALSMLAARLIFRETTEGATALALGSGFSNLVLIGIPLALPAFGPEGLAMVLLIVTFHAAGLIGGATVLVEVARAGRGVRPLAVFGKVAVALLRNPLIVAILAGAAWGSTGYGLPNLADKTISMLSAASVPCALFSLGAELVGIRIRGLVGRTVMVTAFKLVAMPVVVWLLGTYVFGLPPMKLGLAVVLAGLPIGLNVFVFAQRYDIHVMPIAGSVMVTTVLAAVTMTLALAWFAPMR
jgi:predicted permease